MIITDLNDRERKRYADQMTTIASAATRVAESLRTGDDTATLIHLAMLGLAGSALNELTDIFMNAASVSVPDAPPAS